MLFPHLRIHQIFGANTDVGKTIFSTTLALASAIEHKRVFYLKPVSTGAPEDADDGHIKRYTPKRAKIVSHTMMQMDSPVSPHLAAMESPTVMTDGALIDGVTRYIHDHVSPKATSHRLACMYIETAGGVLSPAPSGSLQADAYRPLRLPTVLVADSKLGGISSTIAAYEALNSRGYDVDSVVMFIDKYYRNHEFLKDWFQERDIHLMAVEPPPSRLPKRKHIVDEKNMQQYYAHTSSTSDARSLIALLDSKHETRIQHLKSMPHRALNAFWYPFAQHKSIRSPTDITAVDSAYKDVFTTDTPLPTNEDETTPLLTTRFDGSASWWTQGLGHSNQKLNAAASYAAGRYGHVIFPQMVHEPALKLAERLLETQGKGWATRAFFSDNGSTGMEVALKMALRATAVLYPSRPHLDVLGFSGSYHGDTLGAMDASEGGIYNSTVEWYNGRGLWLDPPTMGWEDGRLMVRVPWNNTEDEIESLSAAYDVPGRRSTNLEKTYRDYITQTITQAVSAGQHFGAAVIEPLVLGAGGMKFVDPLFQTVFVEVVRTMSQENILLPAGRPRDLDSVKTLPVIFDEVFTGLGRLGFPSPSSILGVRPDIAVYAKLLTGGLVPMAVTLASNQIFAAFLGDSKQAALLHGHSYTAYPVGCAVANTSLNLLDEALKSETFQQARRKWGNHGRKEAAFTPLDVPSEAVPSSLWSPGFVDALSRKSEIARVMTLGTLLAFELKSQVGGYGSSAAERALAPLKGHGGGIPGALVHFRTLGNVGYLITSLSTEKHDIRQMEARLLECFNG
ncbi:hypothetical protein M408DRAFT_332195 [Serendipita vermifera MAFF 305830]|uniref:Dethiobiotin synthase n=1 Tax=Serendipita vermifera MAFF 305830 TaxID=933852 RepID=A0A0C2WBB6_SERVB|nr:hypothetical protein M408DRAFT_332195 [Serendipita vermifera MAFF 305830]